MKNEIPFKVLKLWWFREKTWISNSYFVVIEYSLQWSWNVYQQMSKSLSLWEIEYIGIKLVKINIFFYYNEFGIFFLFQNYRIFGTSTQNQIFISFFAYIFFNIVIHLTKNSKKLNFRTSIKFFYKYNENLKIICCAKKKSFQMQSLNNRVVPILTTEMFYCSK